MTALLIILAAESALGQWQPTLPMWRTLIDNCAGSRLVGKNVLVLGPSNLLGPGTVWMNTGGSVVLAATLRDVVPPGAKLGAYIQRGTPAACSMSTTSEPWNLNFGLPLALPHLSLKLLAALQRAKFANLSVTAYVVDALDTLKWIHALASLPPTNTDYDAIILEGDKMMIETNAVRVEDLTATFRFRSTAQADLVLKLASRPASTTGAGVSLSVSRSGNRTISIRTAPKAAPYVVAEFMRLKIPGRLRSRVRNHALLPISPASMMLQHIPATAFSGHLLILAPAGNQP